MSPRLIYSLPFRLYHLLISPFLHYIFPNSGCRFSPTCSQVFIKGIMKNGLREGLKEGLTQLRQCHSFSKQN